MEGTRVPDRGNIPIETTQQLVTRLRGLAACLRDAVLHGRGSLEDESSIVREASGWPETAVVPAGTENSSPSAYEGDTIYRIDERGEDAMLDYCDQWARERGEPLAVVAEGLLGDGRTTFPAGVKAQEATLECIVDPIDGTRGLMYDKRSAWALIAAAPGEAVLGRRPALRDLLAAAQAEIPTSRARYSDTLWAVKGHGVTAETLDLVSGKSRAVRPRPTRATDLAHGFATITKFFPGAKEGAVWLEERLFAEVVGQHTGGAPLVFDDEYISSGGQLYELMMGHDRFIADLRPLLLAPDSRRLCARPYDLCTALIATESGVIVTDAWGAPLDAPLDTATDVAWAGYGNDAIRRLVEPVLQRLLREWQASRL